MGTAIKQKGDDRLPLQLALKQLKRKFPWAPIAALRKQITAGLMPVTRSSFAEKSRIYVRMEDLEKLLLRAETK